MNGKIKPPIGFKYCTVSSANFAFQNKIILASYLKFIHKALVENTTFNYVFEYLILMCPSAYVLILILDIYAFGGSLNVEQHSSLPLLDTKTLLSWI